MATFVLVHSMWHGGWSFDRLRAKLEAMGHKVCAEDLAGCGSDPTPAGDVTLDRWVAQTKALIERTGDDVVLVGHSRGGVVVSQTAEAIPDRILASVYVTALMFADGTSGMDLLQLTAGLADPPSVVPRMTEDGTATLPPEDAATSIYGSCSEADRGWALPKMGKEPLMPLMTALSLSEERYGRVPRVYVETLRDRTLPVEMQRLLIERSRPVEVVTLDSDHMPNMTHVDELARILDDVARGHAR